MRITIKLNVCAMYDIPDAETAFKGEEETENNLSVKKNKNVISAVGVIWCH